MDCPWANSGKLFAHLQIDIFTEVIVNIAGILCCVFKAGLYELLCYSFSVYILFSDLWPDSFQKGFEEAS